MRSRASLRVAPLKVPLSWSTRSRRRPYSVTWGEKPHRRFLPHLLGGPACNLQDWTSLGSFFASTAVCHPVLIFMPLARGAACGQSRASVCGDVQPSPKVCADGTRKSAILGVGSGRRRCRGRAVWAFRGFVRFETEVAVGASGLIAGFRILATFILLTAAPLRFLLPPPSRLPPIWPLSPPRLFPPPLAFLLPPPLLCSPSL